MEPYNPRASRLRVRAEARYPKPIDLHERVSRSVIRGSHRRSEGENATQHVAMCVCCVCVCSCMHACTCTCMHACKHCSATTDVQKDEAHNNKEMKEQSEQVLALRQTGPTGWRWQPPSNNSTESGAVAPDS